MTTLWPHYPVIHTGPTTERTPTDADISIWYERKNPTTFSFNTSVKITSLSTRTASYPVLSGKDVAHSLVWALVNNRPEICDGSFEPFLWTASGVGEHSRSFEKQLGLPGRELLSTATRYITTLAPLSAARRFIRSPMNVASPSNFGCISLHRTGWKYVGSTILTVRTKAGPERPKFWDPNTPSNRATYCDQISVNNPLSEGKVLGVTSTKIILP